jgi:hypothetical protein
MADTCASAFATLRGTTSASVIVARFEDRWRNGEPPLIEEFLASASGDPASDEPSRSPGGADLDRPGVPVAPGGDRGRRLFGS